MFTGKKSPCSVNGFEQLGGQRGGWSGGQRREAILVKVRMKKTMPSHFLRTVLLCKYVPKPRINRESLISDEWMEQVCFRMWAVGTE